jgi:hypothetical protein
MEATGGELFEVQDVAHLDSVFSALIQRIKTRYTLGYYTMANGAAGKPHKLDVRLAPSFGKKGHEYSILAKNGYYVHCSLQIIFASSPRKIIFAMLFRRSRERQPALSRLARRPANVP